MNERASTIGRAFRHLRNDAGMTLLEILVVMVILGMLATLGSVQLMSYLGRAKTQTAKLQVEELATAIELFRIDVGRLPTSAEGLKVLIEAPSGEGAAGWTGPYLRKASTLSDPWNRAWEYRAPGEHGEFDLVSYGADGAPGGEGQNVDVVNWGD